jgi:archaellum component FlaC
MSHDLDQAKKELEDFLQEYPHMRAEQENIEKFLNSKKDVGERLNLLMEAIHYNLCDLSTKLNDLKELIW